MTIVRHDYMTTMFYNERYVTAMRANHEEREYDDKDWDKKKEKRIIPLQTEKNATAVKHWFYDLFTFTKVTNIF